MRDFLGFITTCRHPRTIVNKRGHQVITSCGYCPDCINKKHSRNSNLVNTEMQHHKFNHFITLTYNEHCVPKARIYEDIHIDSRTGEQYKTIRLVDVTKRPKIGKLRCTLPTYNKNIAYLTTSFDDELFKEFYERTKIVSKDKTFKAPSYPFIRWCSVVDLQRFFKRLRLQISQLYDVEIKYFGVSEYGPDTFRPHFHLAISHDSPQLNRNMRKLVAKAWKYGDIRVELPRSQSGTANYVARYINSDYSLPYYLSSYTIKPRSLHSNNYGINYIETLKEFVYQNDRYHFEAFDFTHSYGVQSILLSSFSNHLFPRCYNFKSKDNYLLFQTYTMFEELKQRYNSDRPSVLAKELIFDCHSIFAKYFLDRLLDIIVVPSQAYIPDTDKECQEPTTLLYLCRECFIEEDFPNINFLEMDYYSLSIYNRIYNAILLSKKFLTFNCSSHSPRDVIQKILNYYSQRDLYNLSIQYHFMNYYISRYNTEDLSLFYLNQPNYQYIYDNNEIIKEINLNKDEKYKSYIKKKKLSTLNAKFKLGQY